MKERKSSKVNVINYWNTLFNEENKTAFLSALQNGLGLTAACNLLLLSPKDVSAYVLANKSFHLECQEALRFAAKALLIISNQALKDEKYNEYKTNVSDIRDFIPQLVLWESYKQRDKVKPEDITVALNLFKTIGELATSCGFTQMELLEYVTSNEQLCLYFANKNLL